MQEKAEQGMWPTKAPLGYRNVTGPGRQEDHRARSRLAPLVARLFEWYASGSIRSKEVTRKARHAGLVTAGAAHQCRWPRSTRYSATGSTRGISNGRGRPIGDGTSRSSRANSGSGSRPSSTVGTRSGTASVKHDFAFSGLIACGHCGCSVVGEIKKQRYIYYHCTGYKGRCPEPYMREEVLEQRFAELLGRLTFDDEVLGWVREALRESHGEEKREHEAVERLQAEQAAASRLDAMYVDKLDGRIDEGSTSGRRRSGGPSRTGAAGDRAARDCEPDLHGRGRAAARTGPECAAALRKSGTARKAPAARFRGFELLLGTRELTATLRQPFDLLAEATATAAHPPVGAGPNPARTEIWLGDLDSNQGCPGQSREFYR